MKFIDQLLSRIPLEKRRRNNVSRPKWKVVQGPDSEPHDGSSVFIQIKDGYIMVLDSEDFDYLRNCCICVFGHGYGGVTAFKSEPITGGWVHRIVAAKEHGFDSLVREDGKRVTVDHIDGNPLNNRRSNLRLCDHHGNMRNQHKVSGGSKFKGVYRSQSDGKWCASYSLKEPGMKRSKSNHLGTFAGEAEAARAYDEAILGVFGEFATTNASLGLL